MDITGIAIFGTSEGMQYSGLGILELSQKEGRHLFDAKMARTNLWEKGICVSFIPGKEGQYSLVVGVLHPCFDRHHRHGFCGAALSFDLNREALSDGVNGFTFIVSDLLDELEKQGLRHDHTFQFDAWRMESFLKGYKRYLKKGSGGKRGNWKFTLNNKQDAFAIDKGGEATPYSDYLYAALHQRNKVIHFYELSQSAVRNNTIEQLSRQVDVTTSSDLQLAAQSGLEDMERLFRGGRSEKHNPQVQHPDVDVRQTKGPESRMDLEQRVEKLEKNFQVLIDYIEKEVGSAPPVSYRNRYRFRQSMLGVFSNTIVFDKDTVVRIATFCCAVVICGLVLYLFYKNVLDGGWIDESRINSSEGYVKVQKLNEKKVAAVANKDKKSSENLPRGCTKKLFIQGVRELGEAVDKQYRRRRTGVSPSKIQNKITKLKKCALDLYTDNGNKSKCYLVQTIKQLESLNATSKQFYSKYVVFEEHALNAVEGCK